MSKMRDLMNSLSLEAIVEAELNEAMVNEAPTVGRAFASWARLNESAHGSAAFTVGAMVARRLRHVLERHSEFTFTETQEGHDVKFTVQGPSDFIGAIKRVVEKLTDADTVWADHDVMTLDTHTTREPTEQENQEARSQIGDLVKQGNMSGNSSLSTGARFSWILKGDGIVEDDEFAQEYVSGLIIDGYGSGKNPHWTLELNIWGDPLDEGHEELTYPDGEVYHTEYDAPGEGDRVQDKFGRAGTVQSNEPSKHGHEFSPVVYVEWDDEPGRVYHTTADELTIIPHERIEQEDDGMATSGLDIPQDEIDEFLGSGAHGLDEDMMTFGSDFDDGIADTEVLGLDDMEGSDIGADYCYGSPTGEHHFIDGECVDCGQDAEFTVDEEDVDQVDIDGFDAAPRIAR